MINEQLFNDLFLESHQKLAIKSLQTLNNLENILIVTDVNNTQWQLYNFQPLEYEFYKHVFNDMNIKFKANWFYQKIIESPPFYTTYIIFDNILYIAKPNTLEKLIKAVKVIID